MPSPTIDAAKASEGWRLRRSCAPPAASCYSAAYLLDPGSLAADGLTLHLVHGEESPFPGTLAEDVKATILEAQPGVVYLYLADNPAAGRVPPACGSFGGLQIGVISPLSPPGRGEFDMVFALF